MFGVDDNYRPHVAWFPKAQADAARAAAKQLGSTWSKLPNGSAADLVTKFPAGQNPCQRARNGARCSGENLYEKVVATLNPEVNRQGGEREVVDRMSGQLGRDQAGSSRSRP